MKMTEEELAEHKAAAFERFWEWREDNDITQHEEDWLPWWTCFLEGYLYALEK